MSDNSKILQQSVHAALEQNQSLIIRGSGSKDFYGNTPAVTDSSTNLATLGHCGIINYEPKELVITARSGTPLSELQTTLAQQQQMLAFEPPLFSQNTQQATLGGTIACGFSGPRKAADQVYLLVHRGPFQVNSADPLKIWFYKS